jgi:hypothetical protein
VLAADVDRAVGQLESAWNRIEGSASWMDAAPAWCEAGRVERKLDGLDLQRLAVTGRRAWSPRLLERRRKIHEHLQMAKAGTRILVGRPAPPSGGDGAPVLGEAPDASSEVVRGLREAGWLAESGEPRCTSGEAILVDVRLESQCQRSSLGVEQCSARMAWEGRRCGVERSLFAVSTDKAVGWNSTDRDAALRKAVRAVAVERASKDVRARLLELLGERCPDVQVVTGVTEAAGSLR